MGLFLCVLALIALCLVLGIRYGREPEPQPEPVIVSAVMTAAAHKDVPQAKAIEAAMAQAVHDCLARGVSMDDTVTIRQAMMDARSRVLGA